MDMQTTDQGDVKIVAFSGSLDTGTSLDAERHLVELIDQGQRKLMVDFAELDYVSSAGLRILLVTSKKLSGVGGQLRLCNLNETVQEVFDISGFSTIFKVFADREAALDGF